MSVPFRLDGKVALVTGAASGIGEATSRVLAAAGAAVHIVDLDGAGAARLAGELDGATAHACDITNLEQVAAVFKSIEKLDVLVNNAGIGHVGSIEECAPEDFDRLYRVNIFGMYAVTKAAVPLLLASNGAMVNIGSVAGLIGIKRRFGYSMSKGAVIAMTRQLAVEYPTQMRVNCICPGTVDSPFVEAYLEKYHKDEKVEVRAQLNQRQPIGRLGRPEEIAHMVLYLASDEAGFVQGSIQTIDGGWTAA